MPGIDTPAAPQIDTPTTAPKATVPAPAPAVKPPARSKFSEGLKAAAAKGPDKTVVDPDALKAAGLDTPEPPKPDVAKPADTPKPEPDATTKAAADAAKPADKKTGPWQLKDAAEKKAKAFEARALEAEKRLASLGDVESIRQRADKAEQRLKSLEDEIRYVDYSKSEEYKTKYQQPYEEAWGKAVADMKELTVTGADGQTRAATAQDLLHLSNLPLGEARKLANELFGDAADDVMAHRRRVRELSDAQQKALDDAKKTGSEREQQRTTAQKQAVEQTGKLWHQFNTEDESKYDFLKVKEGDDEWNTKLESARKFVDEAFGINAGDPRLTPDQRADIVRKHASVRGRAIGFTSIKLENTRLKAEIATLNKALAEYKKGEPTGGNGKGSDAPVTTGNAMDRIRADIRRRATATAIHTP